MDFAWPVVLVSMPFMDPYRPSIQLGLLKALAARCGFPVRTCHAYLDFAAAIGVDYYKRLCDHRGTLIGDWLFSAAAFGAAAPDLDAHILDDSTGALSYLGTSNGDAREKLLQIRDSQVPVYLDALIDGFPWRDAAVVGFTSTFQQNTASFALAARLKQRYPEIMTVFGGANFEGEMGLELVRTVDCIDAAVIGEGDIAFPRLLTVLAAGGDLDDVPGLARRQDGAVRLIPAAPPSDPLDDLPAPDYGEYFQRAEELGVLPRVGLRDVWLPIETGRGCWWGAKHHCTFCGLNGETMRFRAKSGERVRSELAEQARRYRSFRFEAVDNILDMAYFTTLFPVLASDETGYEIFYEVKANLSREQLRLMAQAGVTHIQPGIESLSTNVLRLMRKGVRSIQNINLLRWALYYGIEVRWNLLWGFPGETEQDYRDQTGVIRHLRHLPPPENSARIWLERFSPIFTEQDTFRLRYRSPESSYRYIYPKDVNLDRVAYFFDYECDEGLPDSSYADIRCAADEWFKAWQDGSPPVLKYWSAPGLVQIYDERQRGQGESYTLEDTLADLYLACINRPTTAAAVRASLGLDLPAEGIQELFEEFARLGLMFLDGQHVLALAVPAIAGR